MNGPRVVCAIHSQFDVAVAGVSVVVAEHVAVVGAIVAVDVAAAVLTLCWDHNDHYDCH